MPPGAAQVLSAGGAVHGETFNIAMEEQVNHHSITSQAALPPSTAPYSLPPALSPLSDTTGPAPFHGLTTLRRLPSPTTSPPSEPPSPPTCLPQVMRLFTDADVIRSHDSRD